jgi:ectoine hydroxylase-related dioxygenase (phytanoyl-CoA dioxygenase family)
MNSYGVLETETEFDELSIKVEHLRNLGFTTLDSNFTQEKIEDIQQKSQIVADNYNELYAHHDLIGLGESNSYRSPALIDQSFFEIASHSKLQELIARLITGKFYLNQQNLVINPPMSNSYTQLKYHRDLPYQHFVSSRPLAINALYAVDEFTIENGATFVIPASHKAERFPTQKYLDSTQSQVTVKAGTFLVLDCMLYHAAAPNVSKSARVGLNHVFTSVMFAPQINWKTALEETNIPVTAHMTNLLGLDFASPQNVDEYLKRRKTKN